MVYGTVARATARWLVRRSVTRAQVSRIGVLGAVGAAVWFSQADTAGGLAGSAFLAAVLFGDAVRARMRTDRGDALTRWLVAMLSQLREYVVYLGLAAGAVLAGLGGAWGWAAGALVALALRDSLLAAHGAPAAPVRLPRTPRAAPSSHERAGGLLRGLAPQAAHGPRDSDPRLTSRLLGAAAGPATAAVPRSEAVRAPGRAGRPADAAHAPGDASFPTVPRPRAAEADAGHALPALARRLVAFSQPTRFLVIAVTATLWDARVAFVTLVVGCAIAVTGELVDPTAKGVRR